MFPDIIWNKHSIVQSKVFKTAHASISQVNNSKGIAGIQQALGAYKPVVDSHVACLVSSVPGSKT